MLGKTISHYRILEKLGEGGMGEVFLAQDTSLDRKVALKFLPEFMQQDATARKRFLREAKSAAALDHPFICHIHEVGEEGGKSFICMEYVQGTTLKEKLAEGPLPLKEVLEKGAEVAEALEEAHKQGIVHRDVKPSNIMLTPQGHVKVMDFGLAKQLLPTEGVGSQEQTITASLTKTGAMLGTLAYMSPEQVRGQTMDARSDIFSFGVVLYEMLTGAHPFKKSQPMDTASNILKEDPPFSRYTEGIPELLQHTVKKMLAKEPDGRYQSIHEVRTNLRELLQDTGQTTSEAVAPEKRTFFLKLWSGLLGAGILVFLLTLWRLDVLPPPESPVDVDRKSIAVLPFENVSPDPANEYFSDGITEDIITQLSKIRDLRVISRTSAMRYKDTEKSLREIAQELQVAAILEGSVRREGSQVRITAQLIDAQTDQHLWAETYDREITDIFAIQSDVAQQIASSLKVELSPQDRERIEKKPTENLTAYDYYLKGREYYYRYQKQDNENAIELFKKALEVDPNYALAHAGLADAYAQRYLWYGFSEEWLDAAIEESNKAVSLDPDLAEAYKGEGLVQRLLRDAWQREVKPTGQ